MNNMTRLSFLLTVFVALVFALSSTLQQRAKADDNHAHTGHQATDSHGHQKSEKGPHGGRLLQSQDGFALEITIYEPGIPPQARVYAYDDHTLVDPDQVQLVIDLHRFDRIDTVHFHKGDDFLVGDIVIEEPHSFEVKVRSTYRGRSYSWEYESYEGRVEIATESARLSGIKTERAEARTLVERLSVLGQVGFNQDAVKHVAPRYAGVVRSLTKSVGDYVRKGEILGVLHGTDSLNEFSIRAPGSGQVVEKRVTVGEVVGAGDLMFVVVDLSTVWVDFTVYRRDASRVASKQRVRIIPGDDLEELEGTLAYLAPVGDSPSQSVTARAVVRNAGGQLRPGLFVKGEIEVASMDAEVAVRREAIQTFRDWQVVFRNRGALYEIAIVELGIVDGDFIQILSGLSPGDVYVSQNSFIVKADIGKAGASHDH